MNAKPARRDSGKRAGAAGENTGLYRTDGAPVAMAGDFCWHDAMIRLAIGVVFLVLVSAAAEARPRDEAMARAYGCAAQPVTRVWLDCYYGAAQPVRAALGMPPASAGQVRLSEAPPSPGQPADIPSRDAAMTEAARCAGVSEDRLWLDCFYAASNPVRAVLALPPLGAPPTLANNAPQPAAAPQRPQRTTSFLPGLFGQTVIEVRARMVRYGFDAHSKFTVTLDNGQTWRQLEGDSGVAGWRGPADRYLVTITNGALGSHNLTAKGASGMFKVERVS